MFENKPRITSELIDKLDELIILLGKAFYQTNNGRKVLDWLEEKSSELKTGGNSNAPFELMQFVEFFCEDDEILPIAKPQVKSLMDKIWRYANELLIDESPIENGIAGLNSEELKMTLIKTLKAHNNPNLAEPLKGKKFNEVIDNGIMELRKWRESYLEVSNQPVGPAK